MRRSLGPAIGATAVGAIAAFGCHGTPPPASPLAAPPLAAYVLLVESPARQAVPFGRVIVAAGQPCPDLFHPDLLGAARPLAMRKRANPHGFTVDVCEAELPLEQSFTVRGGAFTLPAAHRKVSRVAVLGDSGCKPNDQAGCGPDDPAWPFPAIARAAAAGRPDLVLHVGDYNYRGTPSGFTPPGGGAKTYYYDAGDGTSVGEQCEMPGPYFSQNSTGNPDADTWDAWRLDFFEPAAPLLAAAPWVVARGNHELCSHAGPGWLYFLGPSSALAAGGGKQVSCPSQDGEGPALPHLVFVEPQVIELDGVTVAVLDSANACDEFAGFVDRYRTQLEALAARLDGHPSGQPAWLISHRPIWAVEGTADAPPVTCDNQPGALPFEPYGVLNRTLQCALTGPAGARLLSKLDLLLAGHLHRYESLEFAAGSGRPDTIVVGNSGVVEDTGPPSGSFSQLVDGVAATGLSVEEFGYVTLTRDDRGAWRAERVAIPGGTAPAAGAEDSHARSPCSTSEPAPRLLAPGDAVDAEIRGGERHAFRLQVPPGTYATGRVEQRGVDLVVEVGPEEKPSPRIVDAFQTADPLEFSVLVEHERCVDFVVTPRSASATATSYRLEVLTSRPAEPADTLRIRAEDVVSSAVPLFREATGDSLRKAIERLLEAARLYEEAGAVAERAGTLANAAVIAYVLSEPRQAIELAETAVSLQESVANKEGAASSHLNLAVLYGTLGEVERAQQHHLRAIALAREIGDRRSEATAINNYGVFLGQNGDRQQALVLLEQALAMRRELHDSAGDGATLASLGSFYSQLGEPETAKDYLERALLLYREAQDVVNLATTLNLLGRVRLDLGDTKGALEAQNEALQIERRSGDRRGEAFSAQSLGEISVSLGEHAKALELFQQALELQRALGNRRGEASALQGIANSRVARGESDEAMTAYEAALPLRVAVADRSGEIATRIALARLLRDRGDLAGAEREASAAVDLVEALRTKITAQELRAGFLAGFRGVYDVLVDVLMRLDEKEPGRGRAAQALAVHERGRARALLEQLRENQVELREGVAPELIAREGMLRRTLASKAEIQMRLLSRKDPDIAGAAELAREIDALRLELDRLEAKMRAESPRFAALSPAQPLSLAEIQAEVLDADTVLLEYAVSKEGSYLWVVSRDGLQTHRLPAAEAMEPKARRAYELLAAPVEATRLASDELPRLLRELGEIVLRPAAPENDGKRIVVVPTGALQFLPFAVLPDPSHPDSPLVAGHEVVGLPSASVAAFLRRAQAGRRTPSGTLAVFADPVFSADDERVGRSSRPPGRTVVVAGGPPATAAIGKNEVSSRDSLVGALREAGLDALPRLPFTRREAETILALVPARERLQALDFDASLEAVLSPRLADFRILHFATHGFLAGSHPQYAGLVLSLVDERGQERRGFLSAVDVLNLRLAADLVVLSGCRTGLGKVVAGEGVLGLTRAFLHAGSGRVVASLWPVDDAATAELMRRFYEGMLGSPRLSPPAALREAQLAIRSQRRWQAPFYWAGFQVQGEWR